VISHGVIKEDKVPAKEIERAVHRMMKFTANPKLHTYTGPHDDKPKKTKVIINIYVNIYIDPMTNHTAMPIQCSPSVQEQQCRSQAAAARIPKEQTRIKAA